MKNLSVFNQFCAVAFFVIILNYSVQVDSIPAFPGAEGFGTETKGGRGGRVIKVTNLLPSGPGSLYDACMAGGSRIVVFEVSGAIKGNIYLNFHYITIAGQTAPGEGITIEGGLTNRRGISDMVIRFLRFRQRALGPDDVATIWQSRNVVLDHCSFGWGCDENMDFSETKDITMQWCIINESAIYKPGTQILCHDKGIPHNYGIIHKYGEASHLSLHHTLMAQHERRYPLLNAEEDDIRNNVMYNWASLCIYFSGGYPDQHSIPFPHKLNVVGNYFKRGPQDEGAGPIAGYSDMHIYNKDNYVTNGVVTVSHSLSEPFPDSPEITTHSAQEAYDLVLDKAGAWPRDSLDRRNVNEVRTGTGGYGRKETPLTKSSGTVPDDNDEDGMPDQWEIINGLDPDIADNNGTDLHRTYTNIEVYLNQLAERLIAGENDPLNNPISVGVAEKMLNEKLSCFSHTPNPFSGQISITMPNDINSPGNVCFEIINIHGQVLYSADISAKYPEKVIQWNGKGTNGREVTAGIYLARIRQLNNNKILKMSKFIKI
ncbi:MAG: T9SS type A sorting domain-containing protein [bacterium]